MNGMLFPPLPTQPYWQRCMMGAHTGGCLTVKVQGLSMMSDGSLKVDEDVSVSQVVKG